MASVVELKDLLPPSPPEGHSFQVLYDSVCNNIRTAATTQTVMADFQKCRTDLARVSFISDLPELFEFSLKENYSGKSEDDAASFESVYNMLIPNEGSANKAHEMIMKAIQKTQLEDKTNMAIRFMKRAWSHLLMKDFNNALIDAKRSQTFDAPNTSIWNSFEILGYCYARKKEYKNSEKQFLIALEHLRGSGASNELKATVTGRIMTVFKTVKSSKTKKSKENAGIKEESQTPACPSVNYSPHKSLENISSALDVVTIEGRGRCVVTNKQIKPGDILILDKPYANVLNEDHYHTHCLHCFKRCSTPIPCTSCSKVWFCDEGCRDKCWPMHVCECRVINHLNDPALGKMAVLVFRIMLTIKWECLKNNMKAIEEKLDTELEKLEIKDSIIEEGSVEKWSWDGSYSHRDYNTVFHLVTNANKRSFGDLFKRSLAAIYVTKCLETIRYFGDDYTNEDMLFAASLVLRHMQSSSCNAYEISEYEIAVDHKNAPQSHELGGAIYSSVSLTNHSCFPNTARYNIGTFCVLRATRTIPAGEEVLDNYGYLFNTNHLLDRSNGLQNQYKFICTCAACINNWDVYPHRSEEDLFFRCPSSNCGKAVPYSTVNFIQCPECGNKQQFGKLIKEIGKQMESYNDAMNRIQSNDRKTALNQLLEHQVFLDKHIVLPCSHFTDNQEAIGYCFNFLGNVITPQVKEAAELTSQQKSVNLKKKDKRKYVSSTRQ